MTISGKPATPSVSATGVSTSRMLAPGAMLCDHSTSSVVSPAQPVMVLSFGSYGGTAPAGWMILKEGGAGSPNWASNVARSDWIVGDPYESTITIVWPAPVIPLAEQGLLVVRGLDLGRVVAGDGERGHAVGLGGRLGL